TLGTTGFSCSKSLTGGRSWLGTTLQGQGYYSGIAKDTLAPYPECAGQSSSAGAAVQPLPDGTLVVVMTCNSKTFLSASRDEGATWKVLHGIPQGGTLRAGRCCTPRPASTSASLSWTSSVARSAWTADPCGAPGCRTAATISSPTSAAGTACRPRTLQIRRTGSPAGSSGRRRADRHVVAVIRGPADDGDADGDPQPGGVRWATCSSGPVAAPRPITRGQRSEAPPSTFR